jgi:hypothetical protein
MDLIISLRDDGLRVFDPTDLVSAGKLDNCAIVGVRSGFAVGATASQTPSMGVHFKPGGAFRRVDGGGQKEMHVRTVDTTLSCLEQSRPSTGFAEYPEQRPAGRRGKARRARPP